MRQLNKNTSFLFNRRLILADYCYLCTLLMAGLYIHIPFCKSRCVYCGFYSTTRHELRQRYVDAVCREIIERGERREESGELLETIYLGGGTPSQLTGDQLRQLFTNIHKVYALSPTPEITMECNPDDVTAELAAVGRPSTDWAFPLQDK